MADDSSRGRRPHDAAPQPANPARARALRLLRRLRPEAEDGPPLAEVLDRGDLSGADRRLLHALYLAVCRNRPWLDHCLAPLVKRPWADVEPRVQDILRIGAAQLLCMERIPAHAAVSESVALCRAAHVDRAAGFVNAVLRRLTATPPSPPDPAGESGIALTSGMPDWLVARFVARHGEAEARGWLTALNTPPAGTTVRLNPLRGDRQATLATLTEAGSPPRPAPLGRDGIILAANTRPADLPLLRDGRIYLQDGASQWVAEIVAPEPGERILDACAAPGGKASHLAALMGNDGEVVAVELDSGRAKRLRLNLQRLGATGVRVVEADAATLPEGPPFDRILLDAPCTGLGVMRRHPEIRWRRTAEAVVETGHLQSRLLRRVAAHLRPGGTLVYATCSTEPEEGEEVIAQFLAEHDAFAPAPLADLPEVVAEVGPGQYRTLPHHADVDAFFVARLRRA